jgi:hypothetical protein
MTLDDCEEIFSKALLSKSESEFVYEIDPLWSYYELLSVELGRGSIFWRARPVEEKIYPSVADLKYPPKNAARLNRLNEKGVSCFYAAKNIETALAEIDAQEGQIIQVAGYRILPNSGLRLALIGEYAHVQKAGYISLSGTDPDRTISRLMNSKPIHEALRYLYIDKFFSNILTDENARNEGYLKSRTLGGIIYSKINVDGIAFPSVKDKGGFNVAIKPEGFEEKMHNASCLVIEIMRKRKFGVLEYRLIKSAQRIDDDGSFYWMPEDTPPGIMGVYGMTKDEYEFAIKTPSDKNNLLNITSFYSNRD